MSLAAACGWTLLRTIVLCGIAWPICVLIERCLVALSDRWRSAAFVTLLTPFLFPELLVGYVYRNLALTWPQAAEALCALLVLIRIVPVGVVTLMVSPPPFLSPEAFHCRRLLMAGHPSAIQWRELMQCCWQGPVRRALPAICLMSIVAFQQFEMAALLQTASWIDWFIAAQRVGLEQRTMVAQASIPLLMQLPVQFLAIGLLMREGAWRFPAETSPSGVIPKSSAVTVMAYLAGALCVGCLYPAVVLGTNLPSGLKLLVRQPAQWKGLGREILVAAAISLFVGVTTWITARQWLAFPSRNNSCASDHPSNPGPELRRRGNIFVALRQLSLIPGLLGSLLLGLGTVVLFQQPWLRPVYDTPLPWMVALYIWLLPRAVLLRLWLAAVARTETIYLAEVLYERGISSPAAPSIDASAGANTNHFDRRHSRLLFRLRDQSQLLAVGLLCYWAYLDLPTAYLLAPSGMPSGLVRLYNFMHFGRSAALSAESFVFFGFPLLATYFCVRAFRTIRAL